MINYIHILKIMFILSIKTLKQNVCVNVNVNEINNKNIVIESLIE